MKQPSMKPQKMKHLGNVIPADNKWFARLSAIQIIIDTLEKMDLKYPKLSEEDKAGLDDAKKQLESE